MTVEFMNIPCLQTLYIVEMGQNKSEHRAVLCSASQTQLQEHLVNVLQRQLDDNGASMHMHRLSSHLMCAKSICHGTMGVIWRKAFVGAEEITLDAPKSALSLRTEGTC